MKISVFGLGYVGSVTAVCLAELGHEVVGVDIHAPKVEAMRGGQPPVQEPRLGALLERNLSAGALRVTMDSSEAVRKTTCSVITVGTPSREDGSADLSAVERCVESIAGTLEEKDGNEKDGNEKDGSEPHTLIVRSTVPPGTTGRLLNRAAELSGRTFGEGLRGGMNPEFLREGSAVDDFFDPALVALGADDPASLKVMKRLYERLDAECAALSTKTAELLKYTNNAFHALKISFANEIGRLADAHDIDGHAVMEALCRDEKLNISSAYLRPGFAYGGSCLPKDLRAINDLSRRGAVETPLLRAVSASNDRHIERAARQVLAHEPACVGVLGVTFKAGTDDVRESPALHLVRHLLEAGVDVRMFDVNVDRKALLGGNRRYIEDLVPEWQNLLVDSMSDLRGFADVLVVTTGEPAHDELRLPSCNGALPIVDLTGEVPLTISA